MASSRMARFVSEVAPPQFVSLMRHHRTTKMMDTISEDEREAASMNESSSLSTAAFRQPAAGGAANSVHLFKQNQNQRKFSVFGN
ncbi:hypothetical protein SSX86_027057 [Deinandra increscens subsp. villosa]|uniref:Uncharacterized protein n=1 Tax=Deinandra increscens subsp. villosa TaxID=3103831 RepID=A0AAP0CL19_9ASTR